MEKNKSKRLTVVALVAFAILIVGATYAYLTEQTVTGKMTDINVTSYTTDVLTFATGDDIKLEADQTTFGKEKGSVSGTTYASALLTANNKTNKAVEHYYLYLNIENNTFTYSVQNNKPELIMTITDKDGNEVKNIEGLTYTEVTDRTNKKISGYDITTESGLVTIFKNREITAAPKAEDKWNITITFVNYEENQNANTGKALSAKLMIQKDKIVQTVANICKNGQSLSSCIVAMNGVDDNLYHHDGTLENGITDNSYRYAGASYKVYNYVCFGSNESPCPTDNLYRIIGVFDHEVSENKTEQRVKLIKYDYATSDLLGTDGDYSTDIYSKSDWQTYKGELTTINRYHWNYKNNPSINNGYGSNTWSTSLLNKTNLNTNYLNNIGATWSNLIEDTTWKVSGHTTVEVTPKAMYTAEITNATKTYGPENGTSKIGLMYVSDYGYAASPSAWATPFYDYNSSSVTSENWIYMGGMEWTITPDSSNSESVFDFSDNGRAGHTSANIRFGVRPVLYLKASVAYAGGTGTKDSPITLV